MVRETRFMVNVCSMEMFAHTVFREGRGLKKYIKIEQIDAKLISLSIEMNFVKIEHVDFEKSSRM